MSSRISATAALDKLPVAVSGRPSRSTACRRRIRVLRAIGETPQAAGRAGGAEEGRRHRGAKRLGPAEMVEAGRVAVPWCDLDVADGMEAKPLRDACLHQFDNTADS